MVAKSKKRKTGLQEPNFVPATKEDLLVKGLPSQVAPQSRLVEAPRTANIDPLSSAWLSAYNSIPNDLHLGTGVFTYSMLRLMARVPWVHSIIATRMNQASDFAQPQRDPYSLGYVLRKRGLSSATLTRKDRTEIGEVNDLLQTAGADFFPGGLESFIRAATANTYTFDQINAEKLMNYATGKPWAFIPADPATIRRRVPTDADKSRLRWDTASTGYVQYINNRIVGEYTGEQMAFWVRNREDFIYRFGYGAPELEKAATIIYAMVNAVTHNIVNYTTGIHSQNLVEAGLLGADSRIDTLERMIAASTSGVRHSRRTPIIQTNPQLQEYLKVHPLSATNKDMEFSEWLNILKKDLCAIFQMDPAENGNIFGNEGQKQQINQTSPVDRITASKERGLRPLMRMMARWLNEWLIRPYWPEVELSFEGFDAISQEKKIDLDLKAVGSYLSPNELRIERGLEPWDDPVSNRPLNALYTAYIQNEINQSSMGGVDDSIPGVIGV